MDDWAETDLAWELAETTSRLIPDQDRIEVYIAIGGGYSYTAIGTLLTAIERAGAPISPELAARLGDWLNAYANHEDAPHLHEILESIRSLS